MENFSRPLVDWYKKEARPLPWREEPTPYRVWVSEIMLQQTRIEAAREYFNRFTRAFPTVEALAVAELDDVLKLWEGLGYYSRARNLHKCAKTVCETYGGVFPPDAAALRALPGIVAFEGKTDLHNAEAQQNGTNRLNGAEHKITQCIDGCQRVVRIHRQSHHDYGGGNRSNRQVAALDFALSFRCRYRFFDFHNRDSSHSCNSSYRSSVISGQVSSVT